jgi:hypothetical protein
MDNLIKIWNKYKQILVQISVFNRINAVIFTKENGLFVCHDYKIDWINEKTLDFTNMELNLVQKMTKKKNDTKLDYQPIANILGKSSKLQKKTETHSNHQES